MANIQYVIKSPCWFNEQTHFYNQKCISYVFLCFSCCQEMKIPKPTACALVSAFLMFIVLKKQVFQINSVAQSCVSIVLGQQGRLWLHRQYFSIGSVHCWCSHEICSTIRRMQPYPVCVSSYTVFEMCCFVCTFICTSTYLCILGLYTNLSPLPTLLQMLYKPVWGNCPFFF